MTTSIDRLDISREGLGSALHNGPWFVPRYQREYKWEDKNVKDFLSDIENAIKEGPTDEYFMGSIVIAKSGTDRPEIVDGQQRLATAAIFYAAARDVLSELNADEDAG